MKQKNLFLIYLLAFLPLVAYADAVEIDGIYYNLNADNHTAEVTSNPNNYSGEVVIPSTLTYSDVSYSVTSIGEDAFGWSCEQLTDVIIPSSVTTIGAGAFFGCSSLHNINLPEGLTAIEETTFYGCSSLKKLTIPSTVTRLGTQAFCGCPIKILIIPASVQVFDSSSLQASTGTIIIMQSTTPPSIPDDVLESVGLQVFSNIIVPDGSKSAYQNANVWNRYSDKIVERSEAGGILTEEVTIDQIKYKLNYENYTAEVISKTDKYSGTVVIPSSVIHDQVSYTVNGIGDHAFYQCTGLTELTIPASISYIGTTSGSSEVFRGCNENSFEKVHISDLEAWCRIAFADDYYANPLGVAHHLYLNDSEISDLIIPSTITTLGVFQFTGCYGLNSVTIPQSVVNFSGAVFFDCKNIQSVNIPSGVTSIGVNMFNGCTQLTSVDIPNNITTISTGAFKRTGLNSIRIPNTVISIGDEAFCSCTNLNSVTVERNTPLVITEITFTNSSNATLYVPAGSVSAYSAANYWKDFKSIEAIVEDSPEQEVTDAQGVIYTLNNDGQTYIVSGHTDACTGAITIPATVNGCSVTSMKDRAFLNCTELTSISIPSGVTRIEELTFRGCSNLERIDLPATIQFIGEQAFYECSSLESIIVPNGTVVGKDGIVNTTFSGCTNLRRIEIGDNVCLYQCLFYSMPSLTEVVYGKSVQTSSEAFKKTYPSATLYVPEDRFDYYSNNSPYITIFGTILAKTQEFTDEQGVKYTLNSDGRTYTVSGYTDACTGEITIPAKVNGCSVNCIDDHSFANCTNLTSVTIPNSVKSIYGAAFDCCSNLTSITIPSSVTTIDLAPFAGCSSLASIIVDPDNRVYDSREDCNALIHTASNELIAGCKNTIIPNGVTFIWAWAFSGCSNLTSITIPNSVTDIGGCAFSGCTSLKDVYCYAESVPVINSDTFGDTELDQATLYVPEGCLMAYKDARHWSGFRRIVAIGTEIPDLEYTDAQGVKYTLNDDGQTYTVSGHIDACTGGITIPSKMIGCSVTSIGDEAFLGCENITSISIPNSVTSIGERLFSYCNKLTTIIVDTENPVYDSRDNCNAIIETTTNKLIAGCKSTVIPSSVTSLSSGAFFGIWGLTSITIPKNVTSIESSAFNFTGLTSITVEAGNSVYDSRNNCNAIIETATNTLIAGCINTIIPNDVISIGTNAFCGFRDLTSITIPDGVTSIGDCAFYVTGLTSLVIPDVVKSIGSLAFYCCSDLTFLSIPSSLTSLAGKAFYGCSGLTDVYCYAENVPENVPTTDTTAFEDSNIGNATLHVPAGSIEAYKAAEPWSGFNSIVAIADETPAQEYTDAQGVKYTLNADGHTYTVSGHINPFGGDITIPATVNGCSVTSIGNDAFSCSGLTSVVIPEGVTSIGESAFINCPYMTSATIPTSVTSIGGWAFCNTGISSLNIPTSVASIGECAFGACHALASIQVEDGNTTYDSRNGCNAIIEKSSNALKTGCKETIIPSTVTSISDWAFYGCSGLTSVTIPNRVTSIGERAFYYCSGLTSVTIPNSVTLIRERAFQACSGLTSMVVENGNAKYDSRDNCNALIETATNTLISGCKNSIIPGSVISIGEGAFQECSGLTSVTIPNSVTFIDNYAFMGCSDLTSITIPKSVAEIWDLAFTGCSALTDVYCYAVDVPTTNATAFGDTNIGNATLHVPAGSIEAYKAAEPWSGFNSIVAIADETPAQEYTDTQGVKYTLNGDGQTYTVSDLDDAYTGEIIIPAIVNGCSVTSIGYNAFSYCRNMTSVTIPNSVTSIGQWAFWGCSALSSITIPKSVTSIGDYLFHSCSNLTTIIVETGNPVYDSRDNCNAIIETTTNMLLAGCKSTDIPNTVTSFSSGAFYGIDGFTSLSISKNVISIKGEAFASSGLTSIIVDENNTVYDSRNNCNAIIETATNTLIAGCKNTSIPNNVKAIGYGAFYRSHDLTSVTIPSGVTSIGNWAFGECGSLTSLAIPNGVTSIGSFAFCYCGGITSLSLPNSLTSLGEMAFAECRGLTDVYCFAVNVPTTDANALDSNIGNATLYVPEGCKATYEAADYWKDFKNIVELVLPKAESGLIYSGTAQNLISASSITTMQYSLDGTTYSTTIPQGTDAKEYTIYYKEDNLGIANSIKVTIAPKTVSSPTISLSETTCSYDGTAKEPTVTVKDGSSTIPSAEYTVSYTNNTEVGTATVTITDKEGGNYIVSGSTSFTICRAIKDIFKGSDLWAGYVAQEDLAVPTGLTAYVITSLGNSTATASQITYIPQGVPVLLKRDNTDVNSFEASPGTGTSPTTNLLKAYTTDKTVANREGYVLFKDEFVLVSAGTLPAGKVFLPANSSSKSSTRSIIIDGGDTTDIDGMKVDPDQMDEKWYDLQGRRLDKKPTKKGLYILNGRKVIVK